MPKETKLTAASTLQSLDAKEQKSFRKDPVPVLIPLPKDFQLYKWMETSHLDSNGHRVRNTLFDQYGNASQYWAPWAAMEEHHVPGFSQLRKRYGNLDGGVGRPQELARARFAVPEDWSAMNSLVKAQLRAPQWAFLGVCSLQPFTDNPHDRRTGFFPGGDFQLVVTGMAAGDIFQL